VTELLQVSGSWPNAGVAALAGICALVVFSGVVATLDGGELRGLLARIRRRLQPS
jgi:hypothetical protein